MARCSAVCPNAPSAFMTSASVFHSFVFSSSLKSWSTLVGLVPSNRTRTLIFFFTISLFLSVQPKWRISSYFRADGPMNGFQRCLDFARHDKHECYLVRLNLPVKR